MFHSLTILERILKQLAQQFSCRGLIRTYAVACEYVHHLHDLPWFRRASRQVRKEGLGRVQHRLRNRVSVLLVQGLESGKEFYKRPGRKLDTHDFVLYLRVASS